MISVKSHVLPSPRACWPLLAASLLVLTACGKAPPPVAPPRPLKVVEVGAGETALSGLGVRVYNGEVRSRYASALGFQVGGKIVARLANVGDHVNAGQVLARLDPADTQLTAKQTAAELVQAQAEAQRYRELRAQRFVSQAALDVRETALQSAQAQASLAKNQERYTALVADKSGVIGLVLADIGKVVAPGEVVFRLAPDGDREIALNIPESEYANFRVGMKAEVTVFALPGEKFVGTVREISPLADTDTRTYPMRIQLQGIEKWPTGLTASVRFLNDKTSQQREASLPIPLTAVYQQGKDTAVWVVGADNTVSLRPVTVARYGDQHAYVSAGLKVGERIAAAGVNRLTAGQPVKVIMETADSTLSGKTTAHEAGAAK